MNVHRLGLAAVAALFASACAIGPDYRRPELQLPECYGYASAEGREIVNPQWWSQFGDAQLDALIAEGLANNRDLRVAAARVDQFAGVLGSTRAQLFPQAGVRVEIESLQHLHANFFRHHVPVDARGNRCRLHIGFGLRLRQRRRNFVRWPLDDLLHDRLRLRNRRRVRHWHTQRP